MEERKEYDYIQQWKNILDTDVLRGNINLIAMYIMVYELLEDIIISKPKDFYTLIDFDEEAQRNYKQHVLSLYNKNVFPKIKTKNEPLIASLIWFKTAGAIDDNDINTFAEARTLRNEVTHEMISTITVGTEKIADQFALMYGLFCKIEKWWILEYEVPISGQFKPEEIEEDGVMSGNMILLDIIIDILTNNSNVHFKEACEKFGVPIKKIFMTYLDVIKKWKDNVTWVNGIMNPYVIKEFGGIRPDPTYLGGYIARYDIIDRTFLIDDDVLDFTRSLEFRFRYFNGTDAEKQQEAEQLQQELDGFLTATIAEREQELADLRAQGKVIQTSNPYAWK